MVKNTYVSDGTDRTHCPSHNQVWTAFRELCSAWAKEAGLGQAALLESCPCTGHVMFASLFFFFKLEAGLQFLESGVTVKLQILSTSLKIIFLKFCTHLLCQKIFLNIPFQVSKISYFHISFLCYFCLLCFALLEWGRAFFLFSLKAANDLVPVLLCAGFKEKGPSNSLRKEV